MVTKETYFGLCCGVSHYLSSESDKSFHASRVKQQKNCLEQMRTSFPSLMKLSRLDSLCSLFASCQTN